MKFNIGDMVIVGDTRLGSVINHYGITPDMHELRGMISIIEDIREDNGGKFYYLSDSKAGDGYYKWEEKSFYGKVIEASSDMKDYEPGDYVFIRPNLGHKTVKGCTKEMEQYAGKFLFVKRSVGSGVFLASTGIRDWQPSMFSFLVKRNESYLQAVPASCRDGGYVEPLQRQEFICVPKFCVGDKVTIAPDIKAGEEIDSLYIYAKMIEDVEDFTKIERVSFYADEKSTYNLIGSPFYYPEDALEFYIEEEKGEYKMTFNKGDKVIIGDTRLGRDINKYSINSEMEKLCGSIATIRDTEDDMDFVLHLEGNPWNWEKSSFFGKVVPAPPSRYKVGDYIFIKPELKQGSQYTYYVSDDMEKYAGKLGRISHIYSLGGVELEEDDTWVWSPDMFAYKVIPNPAYGGYLDNYSFVAPLNDTKVEEENMTREAPQFQAGDIVRFTAYDKVGEQVNGLTIFPQMVGQLAFGENLVIDTVEPDNGGFVYTLVGKTGYWYPEEAFEKIEKEEKAVKTPFSLEKFLNGQVVHCKTVEEVQQFCKYLEKNTALTWFSGHRPYEWVSDTSRDILPFGRETGIYVDSTEGEKLLYVSIKRRKDVADYSTLTFNEGKKIPFDNDSFRAGKLAVYCETKEETRSFLQYLEDNHDQSWRGSCNRPTQFEGIDEGGCAFANMFDPGKLGYTGSRRFYEKQGFDVVSCSDLDLNVAKVSKPALHFKDLATLFTNGEYNIKVDDEALVVPFLELMESLDVKWASGRKATGWGIDTVEGQYFWINDEGSLQRYAGPQSSMPHRLELDLSTVVGYREKE